MSLREELIQVAAVAVAIVTDLEQGSTMIVDGPLNMITPAASQAYRDVLAERHRQEEMWGAQHYPIEKWLAILLEEVGEAAKAANDEIIFPKPREKDCPE